MSKEIIVAIILLALSVGDMIGQYDLTINVDTEPTSEAVLNVLCIETGEMLQCTSGQTCVYTSLRSGLYHYTAFGEGYETVTDSITVDGDMTWNIILKKLSVDLAMVEINEERAELFGVRKLEDVEGTSIFAGKKSEVIILEKMKGNMATNNSRQVFAQIAGLNIYEGNDGGLQINIGGRGLDPNRTSNFNTRQNGYDISADVLGYPESYYTPPAEALREIRILRGASSLQYGTQFGGSLDFRLRSIPRFKKVAAYSAQTLGSFNTINSFNYVGFNAGPLSFNGFFQYKKSDGYRPNSAYENNNVYLAPKWHIGENTVVGVEYTHFSYLAKQAGGLTDEQFAVDVRQSTRDRNWFDVDWNLFNVSFDHKFSGEGLLSLDIFGLNARRLSLGYRGDPKALNQNPVTALDEQRQDGTYVNERDLIDGRFVNHGAEVKYLRPYKLGATSVKGLIGLKYYNADNTSRQGPGSAGVDAEFSIQTALYPDYANQSDYKFPNLNLAAFTEHVLYINNKLSVTPGLRLEYINTQADGTYNSVIFDNAGNAIANRSFAEQDTLARTFLLAGLGVSYQPNNSVELIANISQNYRSVTFSDIRVVNPTFIIDTTLRDESGYTFDIGVRGNKDDCLNYNATVFSLLYQDRIGIILDNRANRVRKNIGTAWITGTEALVNLNIARWMSKDIPDYKCNLFLNNAFTFSEYLSSEENNVVGKKVEFIPTVNIKTGLTLGYRGLDISYQWSFISEQFTDVQNSRIPGAGDNRQGIIGEIPAYSVSDLNLSYSYKSWKLIFNINNIFDADYFTRRATGYPGPGIIPSEGRGFYTSLIWEVK